MNMNSHKFKMVRRFSWRRLMIVCK